MLHWDELVVFLFFLVGITVLGFLAACWRQGWRPGQSEETEETGSALAPSLRRSLLALLAKSPAAYGWCRTRWSGATLALS